MKNNDTNPLTEPIRKLLADATTNLSEHDIIRLLEEEWHQVHENDSSSLALFHKHFLVMNALYQIQEDLIPEGRTLSISALAIKIREISNKNDTSSLSDPSDAMMRDYYLDWNNLYRTTEDDVETLLNNFWERYLASDRQMESLQRLGLEQGANWQQISKRYRQLINEHHPDKGGKEDDFIAIRDAYEQLKRLYT